jgi:hypothetical protein
MWTTDTAQVMWSVDERPGASDGEGHISSLDAGDELFGEGAFNDENSRMYYFGSSAITVGEIKETVEKGYFMEGKAHTPGTETVV